MAYKRKASASQINLYNACPRKWFLKYKVGIKEPKTVALTNGSFVHSIIEEFYKLNPKGCGINLNNYETEFPKYMDRVIEKVLKMPRKYFGKDIQTYEEELKEVTEDCFAYVKALSDVKTIMRNFLTLFLMQFQQTVNKCEFFSQVWYLCRIKFSELELSTDDFLGYIDSGIEKDNKLILVDYKTSRYYKLSYVEDYELQLNLYAAMYYKLFNVIPDYCCVYFVRYGIQSYHKIDKMNVVREMEDVINKFKENTLSDNIEDYPMNYDYQFCTCKNCTTKKNRGKSWCYYEKWCNGDVMIN